MKLLTYSDKPLERFVSEEVKHNNQNQVCKKINQFINKTNQQPLTKADGSNKLNKKEEDTQTRIRAFPSNLKSH